MFSAKIFIHSRSNSNLTVFTGNFIYLHKSHELKCIVHLVWKLCSFINFRQKPMSNKMFARCKSNYIWAKVVITLWVRSRNSITWNWNNMMIMAINFKRLHSALHYEMLVNFEIVHYLSPFSWFCLRQQRIAAKLFTPLKKRGEFTSLWYFQQMGLS